MCLPSTGHLLSPACSQRTHSLAARQHCASRTANSWPSVPISRPFYIGPARIWSAMTAHMTHIPHMGDKSGNMVRQQQHAYNGKSSELPVARKVDATMSRKPGCLIAPRTIELRLLLCLLSSRNLYSAAFFSSSYCTDSLNAIRLFLRSSQRQPGNHYYFLHIDNSSLTTIQH